MSSPLQSPRFSLLVLSTTTLSGAFTSSVLVSNMLLSRLLADMMYYGLAVPNHFDC